MKPLSAGHCVESAQNGLQDETLGGHIHNGGLDLGLSTCRSVAEQLQVEKVAHGMCPTALLLRTLQHILSLWQDFATITCRHAVEQFHAHEVP